MLLGSIRCLTTERHTFACVQRGQVRRVRNTCSSHFTFCKKLPVFILFIFYLFFFLLMVPPVLEVLWPRSHEGRGPDTASPHAGTAEVSSFLSYGCHLRRIHRRRRRNGVVHFLKRKKHVNGGLVLSLAKTGCLGLSLLK